MANITTPIEKKTCGRLPLALLMSSGAISLAMISAPKPKPITTMPVTSPFLSGNHRAAVATGVT